MPRAGDMAANPPNVLLIGDAGSGKTSFVTTAGPALELIDLDGNVRSALACGDGLDDARADVEVTPLRSFDLVRKRVVEISRQAAKGEYPYRVVAIDSLTALAEMAMEWAQVSSNNIGKQPTMQEWGTMGREVERVVLALKAAEVATVFIAHEVLKEVDGENLVKLGTPGQYLGQVLPRKFSDINWMRSRRVAGGRQAYEVITKPQGVYKARSSGPVDSPYDATQGIKPLFDALGYSLEVVNEADQRQSA